MKSIRVPLFALALAAFAAPALAGSGGCGWDHQQTTEKPKEQVENPST